MSVLSSSKILDLIQRGDLVISPILSPKQVGPVSIDLRLGNLALMVRAMGLSHVNPVEYTATESSDIYRHERERRRKLERHEVPFREPLLLHTNTLTLVPTLEWVKLPRNVKGVVTARSSWAREGLSIATANFINPGYNGIITLELSNLGQIPMAIYPGMRIAQIAFYEVSGLADDGEVVDSQFNLSFEPHAGNITKYDEAFIPRKKG